MRCLQSPCRDIRPTVPLHPNDLVDDHISSHLAKAIDQPRIVIRPENEQRTFVIEAAHRLVDPRRAKFFILLDAVEAVPFLIEQWLHTVLLDVGVRIASIGPRIKYGTSAIARSIEASGDMLSHHVRHIAVQECGGSCQSDGVPLGGQMSFCRRKW